MNRLETELQRRSQAQRAANRSTRENWRSFTRHRNRVMELLGEESRRQGKVAILGAGNCNDLDLVQLASECGEVHLFDLDREAMEGALLRQGVPERSNIHLRDDLDLSGLSDSEHATGPEPAGDFDLVVSTCVVSQLLETVSRVLPPGLHRDRIMLQVRDAHVRLMTGLTAPGGTGIVVTDMAEADSDPDSPSPPETARKGSHFLGLDPKGIRQALGAVRNLKQSEPWTWQLDPVRRYLVQAVRFTKSARG
ncbi:MAG: class I SAM-dependent methyltransferase [Acidobacteriota bacterium]|nr:class I SAM-dependent methyltransferase [Acidobacteriota bacterium]